ncbi:atp-dependent rna helicase dbp7 [Diplodia corticola]|uniref:Histone acetyltransferase n=1 Tax=Diplodia corticola TaxID=236234 RepID=A0A1J9SJF3_9PEZI|nr:atp-dependent rna helicase dbp7 [Diplodia corticola]OJD40471.1 atp-dependent rna helicase dbp7 [Diplodia corticola]
MAAEPSRLLGQGMGNNLEDEDSDVDAEHEEDVDMIQPAPFVKPSQAPPEDEGSDLDAEGEDIDAEGEEVDDDEDAGEPVGAVKLQEGDDIDAEGEEDDEEAVLDESSDESNRSDSDADADGESYSESEGGNEWENQSDTAEEGDAEIVDPNRCVFCGQDEEHDPSEEFEEYLSCAVCGDNAHRQCARHASSLKIDEDAEDWRCTACVENDLEADEEEDTPRPPVRRRSSAQKLTRDLLPASRGANKPDSHSVFNTLIHPDDPMDGSRSLRKRKAEPEDQPLPVRSTRKRRRSSQTQTPSEPDADDSDASSQPAIRVAPQPVATDDEKESDEDEGPNAIRSSRRTRPRRSASQKVDQPGAIILKSTNKQLIVAFTNLDTSKLRDVLSSTAKQKKRRARDRARRAERAAAAAAEPEVSHYPALHNNFTQFFGFGDREMDESKSKPYGGILSEAEADTSKTFPGGADRKRFEDARLKAEEDWKKKTAPLGTASDHSRSSKVSGPPSKIKCINFGGYEIDTWHAAPYPEEYSRNKVLYICEFCLKYMNSDYVAWRHKLKCPAKHPPGDEIYRDGRFSFFEVDGRKNPVYCQNLCLLAKLFLGSKTLYYDVEPFLFYVMTETDDYGCHFVGYFSKEKRPSSLNNVSCILVLPIHQRKGFGHMLIEFSYLLTRVEKKTGSPEKPLSDMGLVSYRSYWRLILCYQLMDQRGPISITTISERTGMTADDIVSALEGLRALVRDPVTKKYALRLDYDYFRHYIDKFEAKQYPQINAECLVWTPYVMGHNNLSHYDDGPPLQTVAQREGEDDEKVAPEEGVQMAEAAEHPETNGHQSDNQNDEFEIKDDVASTGDAQSPQRPKTPKAKSTGSIKSNPSTPQANGTSHQGSTPAKNNPVAGIPPTRFEVFPPIPGTAAKKRGRPFSSSSRRNATPVRSSTRSGKTLGGGKLETPLAGHGKPLSMPTTVRRTRSKLGEIVVNGLDSTNDSRHGSEEKPDNGRSVIKGKGVGKTRSNGFSNRIEDDEDDEDGATAASEDEEMGRGKGKSAPSFVEVGEDLDADGDIDAIGEDDPDV